MSKRKLPFGIAQPPMVSNTKACLVVVDDHLGKSSVMVETWWSGEGFTIQIDDSGKTERLEVTWTQSRAIRLALDEIKKAEVKDNAMNQSSRFREHLAARREGGEAHERASNTHDAERGRLLQSCSRGLGAAAHRGEATSGIDVKDTSHRDRRSDGVSHEGRR